MIKWIIAIFGAMLSIEGFILSETIGHSYIIGWGIGAIVSLLVMMAAIRDYFMGGGDE